MRCGEKCTQPPPLPSSPQLPLTRRLFLPSRPSHHCTDAPPRLVACCSLCCVNKTPSASVATSSVFAVRRGLRLPTQVGPPPESRRLLATDAMQMELIHKRLTSDDRGDSDVSPRRRVLWLLYSCDGNTLNRGYKTRRKRDARASTPKR